MFFTKKKRAFIITVQYQHNNATHYNSINWVGSDGIPTQEQIKDFLKNNFNFEGEYAVVLFKEIDNKDMKVHLGIPV